MCYQNQKKKSKKLSWIILASTASLTILFAGVIVVQKTKPINESAVESSNADTNGSSYKNLILKDIKKYDENFMELELYDEKQGIYYRLCLHESYSDKITKGETYDVEYVYQKHSILRPEFEIYSIKKSY